MYDVNLSERAAQLARAMLVQRHENGDYMFVSAADMTVKTGLPKTSVSKLLSRLRELDWLEDYRNEASGYRLYRFTQAGAKAAAQVLADAPPRSPSPAAGDRVRTLADIEATELPGVVAAVRRQMQEWAQEKDTDCPK